MGADHEQMRTVPGIINRWRTGIAHVHGPRSRQLADALSRYHDVTGLDEVPDVRASRSNALCLPPGSSW